MTCENCVILEQKMSLLTKAIGELDDEIEELRENRDVSYQAYVATDTNLAECRRDMAKLRQGLADLLV